MQPRRLANVFTFRVSPAHPKKMLLLREFFSGFVTKTPITAPLQQTLLTRVVMYFLTLFNEETQGDYVLRRFLLP